MQFNIYLTIAIAIFIIICQRDPNVPAYIKTKYSLYKLNFHRWLFGIRLRWQLRQSLRKFKKELYKKQRINEDS